MNSVSKTIKFSSCKYHLTGFLKYPLSDKLLPGILFIHGAGEYAENLYESWQQYLCDFGFASFSFFCRGVGNSEGNFVDGSLNHRLEDSLVAYNTFIASGIVDPKKITVAGSSMGGHVAIRLVEIVSRIKSLILQSAAAYSAKAESLPLNNSFSAEIRTNHKWEEFPIFAVLKNFVGATLVVYGENDKGIPDGVKNEYRKSITRGKYLTLVGGQHTLLRPKTKPEMEARDELFKQSILFLKNWIKC